MIEPLYFNRKVSRREPILPLLITSLPATQTTILIGPQSIAQRHDQFLNAIYANVPFRSRYEYSLQRRSFAGLVITLVTFHTDASDGSRTGLLLSFGVATTKAFAGQHPELITRYLHVFFATANRLFGTLLPNSGSQRLVELLRSDMDSADLHSLGEIMLLSSTAIGETLAGSVIRYIPRLMPRRRPFAILYADGDPSSEALSSFVYECSRRYENDWSVDGHTAAAYSLPSDILRYATDAKIIRRGKLRYLVLMRNAIRRSA